MFLSLREKYSSQFDDKKTNKSQIWRKIWKEMEEAGYNLGDNGVERCRQKFANLQKQYLAHLNHMKKTGSEQREQPLYFDKMHNLLHMKDKINPQNLQESTGASTSGASRNNMLSLNASVTQEISESTGTAEAIRNRFRNTKNSVRPESSNAQLLDLCKRQFEEDKETKKRLIELLEEQNRQRGQMLEILSKLVGR
ncbi:uncharacterized protein LOC123317876 [Coccinella septempunctata]|uniref:uncharacterized protein LOC123317876 n=1 Tax=Coccinella septempunctata TaxID=41139 RepID=UPI001D0972F0|nr:uncharacterized protein LOC123317876 [Coccinella septempunctata]